MSPLKPKKPLVNEQSTKTSFTPQAGSSDTANLGPLASLPWRLNATFYNSTKGVTTMLIKGVHITFSATGCSGTLNGTGATNSTGVAERRIDAFYEKGRPRHARARRGR
jgi:hypothetical protein